MASGEITRTLVFVWNVLLSHYVQDSTLVDLQRRTGAAINPMGGAERRRRHTRKRLYDVATDACK